MIWTFVKTHWRPLAVALALLCAFAIGRFTKPPTVTEKLHETVKTITVEDTQSKEMVRVLTAQLTELKRNVHRVTHTITRPDGTSDTTTTVDSTERHTTDTRASASADTQTSSHAKTDTSSDRTASKVTDTPRAQWHVSALVGLDAPALLKGKAAPLFGAHAERRLGGPFFAGAWGLGGASGGAGGLSLGLEW